MYQKTTLDNGIRIITEKLDHFMSISLGIWVGVGSRDEDINNNGISHFIEHMVFKGTPKRDSLQIAKELDAIGGFSNAFTGKEYTCFHSKVLDRHFPRLAEILSDIFANSVFNPDDIEREKQVVLQEISMVEDTPDEYIHDLFNQQLWVDHPLGRSVLGTTETVDAVSRESILGYMSRFYVPERIIITAAGNINHDDVVKFFSPIFKSLSQEDNPISVNSPRMHKGVFCHHRELEQVYICMGGEAPHLSSELRFAGGLLNIILGGNMSSRLFQEIREKRGLAYSIYSYLSQYLDTGLLGISVGTESRQVNHALAVINKEIEDIKAANITEDDLQAAKEHLTGGILLSSENSDARMMRLAKNEFVFGRYVSYEELVEELNRVTLDEVVNCARDTFKNGQVSLATLGPIKEQELDLEKTVFTDA